jgi:hypothetical protein
MQLLERLNLHCSDQLTWKAMVQQRELDLYSYSTRLFKSPGLSTTSTGSSTMNQEWFDGPRLVEHRGSYIFRHAVSACHLQYIWNWSPLLQIYPLFNGVIYDLVEPFQRDGKTATRIFKSTDTRSF